MQPKGYVITVKTDPQRPNRVMSFTAKPCADMVSAMALPALPGCIILWSPTYDDIVATIKRAGLRMA